MSKIPKSLYSLVEMRRSIAKEEDERLKEYVIVNLCPVIAIAEVNRILKKAKKDLRRKTRINKLMVEQIDVVIKDTKKILKPILEKNQLSHLFWKCKKCNQKMDKLN